MKRKQTKIVATVSDLKCDVEFIQELYNNGVNVVRLNTAHQGFEDTLRVVNNVRAVSENIGLLLDTKGPEVRTMDIDEPIEVKTGDIVHIVKNVAADKKDAPAFAVNYDDFTSVIPVGSEVLIDDGETGLIVEKSEGTTLICRAQNNGKIKNKKSVNVPDVAIDLPSLTQKDKDYIKFAAENNLDFVAHSFVRHKQDVLDVQKILDENNGSCKIIAKIENRQGVDNIEEILDYAYGVMIARGDLGIEIPAEEVPGYQKKMIDICIRRGQPVITATQMLHTMIDNPRPTRAEVSDVANAIYDGTDAVMLSGETAYGKYPMEAVQIMAKICRTIESQKPKVCKNPGLQDDKSIRSYLVKCALGATTELEAKAIVADTVSGYTARLVAAYRGPVPVYVKCHDKELVRHLSLVYGVYPSYMEAPESTEELITKGLNTLVDRGDLNLEDMVVVIAGNPKQKVGSDFIEINTVSNCMRGIRS